MRLDDKVRQLREISKSRAQQLIRDGYVLVNNQEVRKNGTQVRENDVLTILESPQDQWVSRSALKLLGGLEQTVIQLNGLRCLDVGSSTGGFTQVCLTRGASHVISVDVGKDQLVDSLRNHPKVTVMEQTDIRDVSLQDIGGCVDFLCCDVSFISLDKLYAVFARLMCPGAHALILFKPQFECGMHATGPDGVVRDKRLIRQALDRSIALAKTCKLAKISIAKAAIQGKKGNQEYIIEYRREPNSC